MRFEYYFNIIDGYDYKLFRKVHKYKRLMLLSDYRVLSSSFRCTEYRLQKNPLEPTHKCTTDFKYIIFGQMKTNA